MATRQVIATPSSCWRLSKQRQQKLLWNSEERYLQTRARIRSINELGTFGNLCLFNTDDRGIPSYSQRYAYHTRTNHLESRYSYNIWQHQNVMRFYFSTASSESSMSEMHRLTQQAGDTPHSDKDYGNTLSLEAATSQVPSNTTDKFGLNGLHGKGGEPEALTQPQALHDKFGAHLSNTDMQQLEQSIMQLIQKRKDTKIYTESDSSLLWRAWNSLYDLYRDIANSDTSISDDTVASLVPLWHSVLEDWRDDIKASSNAKSQQPPTAPTPAEIWEYIKSNMSSAFVDEKCIMLFLQAMANSPLYNINPVLAERIILEEWENMRLSAGESNSSSLAVSASVQTPEQSTSPQPISIDVYDALLTVWNKSKRTAPVAANRVMALYRMIESQSPGLVPTSVTYSTILEVLSRSKHKEAATWAKQLYTSRIACNWNVHKYIPQASLLVFEASSNSPVLTGGDTAHQLLYEWIRAYTTNNDKSNRNQRHILSQQQNESASSLSSYTEINPGTTAQSKESSEDSRHYTHSISPDHFLTVMRAYAVRGQYRLVNTVFEELLDFVQKQQHTSGDSINVSAKDLSAVIAAYARSPSYDRAVYAEKWIDVLNDMYKADSQDARWRPTPCNYKALLQVWAESPSKEAVEGAEAAFRSLVLRQQEEGDPSYVPDIDAYNCVFKAWSRSDRPDAARVLEHRLSQMRSHRKRESNGDENEYSAHRGMDGKSTGADQTSQDGDDLSSILSRMHPNIETYNKLLYAYSRSNQRDAPRRADALFQEMLSLSLSASSSPHEHDNNGEGGTDGDNGTDAAVSDTKNYPRKRDESTDSITSLSPNEASYVAVMTSWNRSMHPAAIDRVEYYFADMIDRSQKDPSLQPRLIAHNAVLLARKEVGDGASSERLLRSMISKYEMGEWEYCPTRSSFEYAVTAWVKSRDSKAPYRAEGLVNLMRELHKKHTEFPQVDNSMYTALMNCWAHSTLKEAPEKTEALLVHIQRSSSIQNQRDTARNATSRSSAAKQRSQSTDASGQAYAFVAMAWSRSKAPYAAERAQQVLDSLLKRHKEGDTSVGLSRELFHAVMIAWARSKELDSAERAYRILRMMEEHNETGEIRYEAPNKYHYATVINAYAEKGEALRAESLLQQFINEGKMEPHETCYTNVIKAYGRSRNIPDAPERAEAILRIMNNNFHNGQQQCAPSRITYTNLLYVWLHSRRPDALAHGEELLREQMEKAEKGVRGLVPDIHNLTVFLRIVHQDQSLSMYDKQKYAADIEKIAESYRCNLSHPLFQQVLSQCRGRTNAPSEETE
jgi:PPR repeat